MGVGDGAPQMGKQGDRLRVIHPGQMAGLQSVPQWPCVNVITDPLNPGSITTGRHMSRLTWSTLVHLAARGPASSPFKAALVTRLVGGTWVNMGEADAHYIKTRSSICPMQRNAQESFIPHGSIPTTE